MRRITGCIFISPFNKYYNMSTQLQFLFISTIVLVASSQPSYQERAIYLSNNDNICHFDAALEDQLYLILSINGSPSEKIQQWGMCNCRMHGWTDAERISSTYSFSYINENLGDWIMFKQEVKYNYLYSFLHSIVMKVT